MKNKTLLTFIFLFLSFFLTMAYGNSNDPEKIKSNIMSDWHWELNDFENILKKMGQPGISEESLNLAILFAEILLKSGYTTINDSSSATGGNVFSYLTIQIIKGNLNGVRFLIEQGALEKEERTYDTLLWHAVNTHNIISKKADLLEYLVVEVFKIDFRQPEHKELGVQLLQRAVDFSNLKMAEVLISQGVELSEGLNLAKSSLKEAKATKVPLFPLAKRRESKKQKEEIVKMNQDTVHFLEDLEVKRNCETAFESSKSH